MHAKVNISCRFVWRKKIDRDVAQGMPLDAFSLKAEKKKQRDRMVRVCLLACMLKIDWIFSTSVPIYSLDTPIAFIYFI